MVANWTIELTKDAVEHVYKTSREKLAIIRTRLNRPLTLAEKVLYGHLNDPEHQDLTPGKSILALRPDRVVMQDALAQMVFLQFAQAKIPRVSAPSTVHCDHLIRAHSGAKTDIDTAITENQEVYEFLRTACAKYGVGFWKPGSGIIHQVFLEQYAFPGGMVIGTDSHTPNAGGLGMVAVGVGGGDAVDVMSGMPWEVLCPKLIGVKLTGELSGWTAPKDIILALCGILTVKGGTNRIIEYFGPGARTLSATGKATITNMGAELGATTSMFPFDAHTAAYLTATARGEVAALAAANKDLLEADPEVEAHPERFFERVVEINLSELEPHIVGPHTPDLARPISKLAAEVKAKGYPDTFAFALIGSCTNSSYEDMGRAADVASQASTAGFKTQVPLMVTPGSEQIHQTIRRDGQMAALESIGATVLANACGPCIGQWKRDDVKEGDTNAILTSYNRNFPKRNDGLASTMAFMGSPELVVAMGLSGRLTFNPLIDTLEGPHGTHLKLQPPKKADPIPKNGFVRSTEGYMPPPADGASVTVSVSPTSPRLQLLEPFLAWDGKDFIELPILIRAKGKCTTDHISPAGIWLKYRGHLDKFSDNMFMGAVNAYSGESGTGLNVLTGERNLSISAIARMYKAKGLRWVVIGDENYGEGSSREHAAMSPRYLGCAAVIAKSFARIHETNLKKQGVLPLTFTHPEDYDAIQETDRVSFTGLSMLSPGKPVNMSLRRADGTMKPIELVHSLTSEHIAWFKAGSALNLMRSRSL